MVLDEETLVPLHDLTKEGEEHYKAYLIYRADMLLLRNMHPLMYLIMTVSSWVGFHKIHDKIYDRYFKD